MNSLLMLPDLRKVVVDALKSAEIFSVGERVFTSRTENVWEEEGNVICVYTPNHKFDDGARSPVIYGVTTDVVIDVIVQNERTFEIDGVSRVLDIPDQMDYITQKILNCLVLEKTDSNIYSNLPFKKIRVDSVTNILNGNGEIEKGGQRINLVYSWYMQLPQPGIPDGEFLIAHTKIVSKDTTETEFDVNVRGGNV